MTSLILSEIFPPKVGGSGQWLYELYRRQPVDKTILLVGDHKDASTFDSGTDLRIVRSNLSEDEWTLMTKKGLAYVYRMYKAISELRKKFNISQIHVARVMPEGMAGYLVSKLHRVPLVCFVHGEDIELALESRESKWIVNMVISQSTRLICNSNNSRRMLVEKWNCPETKIKVLHPGIDTNKFHPATNKVELRQSLGWEDKKVLLTVSRLEKRKGHDIMINAMPGLLSQCPNLHYAIVGHGAELENLKNQVNQLNLEKNVSFYGEAPDESLIEFIQATDLFILPNRRVGSSVEGFGIVLLEAQACGIPVIAGDSGGTSETLDESNTGIIVDCTRPENIVSSIAPLLANNSKISSMGGNAREYMENNFSWEALTEQMNSSVFINQ